ncbi:MAG TPA: glycosyltransferase family 39 protein, partial [Blastocatellia bacterium]|nr:glycosyltransferase family 39 protein [Blastocatellia bacterium]
MKETGVNSPIEARIGHGSMGPIHAPDLQVTLSREDSPQVPAGHRGGLSNQVIVVVFAAVIFFGCLVSPPSLMDDVDAVQAQIARNMIHSGDWVTARLDGVVYMEKAPLKYWMIATSFLVFGERDWAARIPVALSVVLLCWLVSCFGQWAFGKPAGMYAGLALGTSVGLFLFTRVLIPDCILTLAITAAMYAVVRLIEDEKKTFLWPLLFWVCLAAGVLLKGLIGFVFPVSAAAVYLLVTRRAFQVRTWARFRPVPGLILFLALAAPWHVLAAIRNPPLFDFTLHSESGSYHGFFWFYFINEQLLRFLNRRYPRDYDTVPRVYFWLLHLIWLFPWSLYLPAVFRLDYRAQGRASRCRLLALCWIGVVLIFFSLSTTQEYYSLPCYPAFALLIGSALVSKDKLLVLGSRLTAGIASLGLIAVSALLYLTRGAATPADISAALIEHPQAYTLSLGHLTDLTLSAFAYLRLPLAVAAVAFAIGAIGAGRGSVKRAVFGLALMMVVLFHA